MVIYFLFELSHDSCSLPQRSDMELIQLKLQEVAAQLPPHALEEVIDFAEFLAYRTKNGVRPVNRFAFAKKRFELPVIKNVKFTGDPRLRREDLYDDLGR
jgi:hypothetical protein